MHGDRRTHRVEVSIFDRLMVVIDKLTKLEETEMLKYSCYKLMYCMGKI